MKYSPIMYALLYDTGRVSAHFPDQKDVIDLIEMLDIRSLSHHVVGILIIKLKTTN